MRETTRTILAAVSVAAVMALLLPVGAHAAGQLMTIVDADSSAKAQVEAGKLRVGDGDGAMTVDGAVGARPALPAEPFSVAGTLPGTNNDHFVSLGRGRIAITDVVISQSASSSSPTDFRFNLYRDGGNGDCTTLGAPIRGGFPNLAVPIDDTVVIHLSTPVVATARPLCLRITTYTPNEMKILSYTITGYRT